MENQDVLIWHNPQNKIIGFHFHMDFEDVEKKVALNVYEKFIQFLQHYNIIPSTTRIYEARENGPHLQAGWEVKFENPGNFDLSQMSLAITWLMCNRQKLSVFMHPVTWLEKDVIEELYAHENYAMVAGNSPSLDLNFFRRKIACE